METFSFVVRDPGGNPRIWLCGLSREECQEFAADICLDPQYAELVVEVLHEVEPEVAP